MSEKNWSTQQQDIFSFFRSGKGNLVVRARAGTGKTTTIVEACGYAAHEDKILLAAFNKKIATELQQRVSGANVEAKTLHALGYSFIRRQWSNARPDDDVDFERARQAAGRNAPDEMVVLTKKLASLLKSIDPFTTDAEVAEEIAERFDLTPEAEWEEEGWDATVLAKAAIVARDLAKERDELGRISFDDMVFVPVALGFVRPHYSMVVIDEAQDMNTAQLLLAQGACKKSGRVVVVGDDRQCHPAGVMVATSPGKEVPIEKLHDGDVVMGWNRNAQKMVGGRRVKVASRRYAGLVHDVVSNGRTVPATSNHKFLCRWTNRDVPTCVTYLMWRRGYGFRVGWCQLFTKNHRIKMMHLAQRARTEKADKTWILKVHSSRTEASVYESIIAGKYALPTATFEPVHGAIHLTRETIKQIFKGVEDTTAGSNHDNGVLALSHHGRTFEQHFYPWPGLALGDAQGRRTYFEVHASNLLPNLMSLPSPDSQNEWHPISSVANRDYKGIVYSLDVAEDHSYSANGVVVLNCIYSFRGADAGAFDRLKRELDAKELGLTTTYRCGRAIVGEANRLVPDFHAGENNPLGTVDHIQTDEIVNQAKPGDFVLSRANAPLMGLCLAFLKKGVRARIEGRDVAKALKNTILGFKAKSVAAFMERIDGWQKKQGQRALKMKNSQAREKKLEEIADQADMLRGLAEGAASVNEILTRTENLFGDTDANAPVQHVVLSSVHRSKGLEADRVFIIAETIRGGSDEEENIEYVAITRARKHLTWVGQKKARKS